MPESERATAEVQRVPASGAARPRLLTPGELAWIALIPCAVLMVAAILVLGPPLGHGLFRPGADSLWPVGWWEAKGRPEPVKHGRYLLAIAAPLVLAVAIVVLEPRRPRLSPRVIRGVVLAAQLGVLAFVTVAVLAHRGVVLSDWAQPEIFSNREFATGAALVALATLACRRRRVRSAFLALAHERRLTRALGFALATGFAALWAFEGVRNDGWMELYGRMNWIPSGAYAVLDGRTPLVDAHVLYAKLLPYPMAVVMATFGATALVFTTFAAILTVVSLLAVYAIYRRMVGSAFALVLFLPFVALSGGSHAMEFHSIWPMRYVGPYLLAWLCARHLDGRAPRRPWVLFFVAGFVVMDMPDFGLAALLATSAALLLARPPRTARAGWSLVREVAIGVVGAVSLLTIFTLLRAGEPPSLAILLEWSRIFTNLGLFSYPPPAAGFEFVMYATLASAIAVAAVRAAGRADDTLLTGMLAWSGTFGLVAGNYYIARADPLKLAAIFSAWGFALGLLVIVCVRALEARDWRAPTPAELLVLLGFAVSICTVVRVSSPAPVVEQLSRAPQPTYLPMAKALVAAYTHRGEKVVILLPEGYRIAYELGLRNVSPYEMENAIVTRRQMKRTIDVMRREGVTTLFTPAPGTKVVGDAEAPPEHADAFRRAGFQAIALVNQMIVWRRSA